MNTTYRPTADDLSRLRKSDPRRALWNDFQSS